MPTCQKCNQEWNWKQTMKASFTFDDTLTCALCGSKQYITANARKRSSFVPFIIPIALLLNLFDA